MAWVQDLRFAFRTFRKSPGFVTVIVLTLGVGIGANTAMFTLVNDILLKPLPSPEGDRIMHLGTKNVSKSIARANVSYPDFLDWRARSRSFSNLELIENTTFNVSDGLTAAEPVPGARITADAFRTLHVLPLLGRDFQVGEDQPGSPGVCILGYTTWVRRYARDAGVIGKTIRVDQAPVLVIGIMPEGMSFPATAGLWMPLVQTAEFRRRDVRQFQAFGRLRGGVSPDQAQAEMEVLGQRLEAEHPDSNQGVRPVVTPYTQRAIGSDIRLVLLTLQCAVGILLLVVCANAANLLLSRSVARTREIAIRSALGASGRILVRQLLVESVAYAGLGGVLGLVLAHGAIRAFNLSVPAIGKPYWLTFDMDYRVFGFLAAATAVAGIGFGLAPALHLARAGATERLKEGERGGGAGRASHRLANAFVVAQISLTVMLLIGIGLLARTIVNIYRQGSGIDAASVLTLRVRLPDSRYQDGGERTRLQERLLAAMRQLPQVESAAITSHLPLAGSDMEAVEPEGYPAPPDGKPSPVATLTVSTDYFRTFGIRMTAGREFAEADGGPGEANVVINQRFAAKYWPGQQALRKRVRITRENRQEWLTVVGISSDVRQNQATAKEIATVVYLPNRKAALGAFFVVLRTGANPENLTNAARQEIARIDPDLPVTSVMTMAEVLRLAHWPHRVFGSMFGIFGLVAAALAGLGTYGVMAYSVGMRTQEIGLRMAIGATGGNIRRMVISRGLRQAAGGLSIGFLGALLLTRGLRALLVEVSATDPVTFLAVGVFQATVALLACWLPARRAAGVHPLAALRHD